MPHAQIRLPARDGQQKSTGQEFQTEYPLEVGKTSRNDTLLENGRDVRPFGGTRSTFTNVSPSASAETASRVKDSETHHENASAHSLFKSEDKLPHRLHLNPARRESLLWVCIIMGIGAILAGILAGVLVTLERAHGIRIPDPNPHDRSFSVAHARTSFIDTARKDPYDASANRKVGVSLFVPVKSGACTKQCDNVYMPDQTARVSNEQFFGDVDAHFFEKLMFQSCCASSGPVNLTQTGLVVLEPGVATSRFVYNQLARQMSANGFVVVTIDHPHDASIVEFDDANGKGVIRNNGALALDAFTPPRWNDVVAKAVDVRRKDIDFVLQKLSSAAVFQDLWPGITFNSTVSTDSFAVIGHGLGGTVATSFSANSPQTRFSINLSGAVPSLHQDIKNHVIFFGRDGYTQDQDAAWKAALKHFTGRFVEWDMQKGGQMDYTDLPWMVDLVKPSAAKFKGTGDAGVWAFHCTSCFLEAYLRDETQEDRAEITKCLILCQEHSVFKPHGG